MGNYSGIYSVNEMFRLYPITFPMKASGGAISDFEQDGVIYRMHKFIDVGEQTFEVGFVPRSGAIIDFLVVAGVV